MSIRALCLTICLSVAVVLSAPADKKCSPAQVEMLQSGRVVAANANGTVISLDQSISIDTDKKIEMYRQRIMTQDSNSFEQLIIRDAANVSQFYPVR